MDTRYFKLTRNYANELKYETQIYWFLIISFFLALAVGYGSIKDANSAVYKKSQIPSRAFSDPSIAIDVEHVTSHAQTSPFGVEGRAIHHYQGGT